MVFFYAESCLLILLICQIYTLLIFKVLIYPQKQVLLQALS